MEIDKEKEKIRLSVRHLEKDPFDYFKDKKNGEVVTVKVHSVLKKTSPPPSTILPESIIDLVEQNRSNLEFWKEPKIKSQPMISGRPETKTISYNLFSNK